MVGDPSVAPDGEARPADAPGDPAGHLPYLPALDGLRAMAVLVVLLFHAEVPWMPGGFLGVSVFFTLSGFLITSLLLRERHRTGGVHLRGFWSRRFRRLLPASLAGIVLATAFVLTAGSASQLRAFRLDALGALADVANWRFLLEGESYLAAFNQPSPLLHYWSLAIEEQCYLLLPLLVAGVLAWRAGSRRALAPVLGGLFVLSALLPALTGWSGEHVYLGTFTRAAELLAGALLALALARRPLDRPVSSAPARAAVHVGGSLALVGLLALCVVTAKTDAWVTDGGLAAFAGLSVLVILAAVSVGGPVAALLGLAPLRWLGRISYGVYLYHWPVFLWLAPERTGLSIAGRLLIGTAITLVLAVASFRWLEQPIRTRRALAGRPLWRLAPVAVGLVAVLVLAVTVSVPDATVTETAAESEAGALVSDLDRLGAPPDDDRPPLPVAPVSAAAAAPTVDSGPVTATAPTTTARSGPPTTVSLGMLARDPTDDVEPPPGTPSTLPPAPPVRLPSRPLRMVVLGDSTAIFVNLPLNRWGEAYGAWNSANFARIGCGIGRGGTRVDRGQETAIPDDCGDWEQDWPAELAKARPDVVVISNGLWDAVDRKLPGDDRWRAPGDPVYDAYLEAEYARAADVALASGAPVLWLDHAPVRHGQNEPWPSIDFVENQPERMTRLNEILDEVAATRPGMRVVDYSTFFWTWPGGPFDEALRKDGLHVNDTGDAGPILVDWLGPVVLDAYWRTIEGRP